MRMKEALPLRVWLGINEITHGKHIAHGKGCINVLWLLYQSLLSGFCRGWVKEGAAAHRATELHNSSCTSDNLKAWLPAHPSSLGLGS